MAIFAFVLFDNPSLYASTAATPTPRCNSGSFYELASDDECFLTGFRRSNSLLGYMLPKNVCL